MGFEELRKGVCGESPSGDLSVFYKVVLKGGNIREKGEIPWPLTSTRESSSTRVAVTCCFEVTFDPFHPSDTLPAKRILVS